MRREERLNNHKHVFKSESNHIEHTIQRFKERHGIEITVDQYYELLNLAIKGDVFYDLNSSSSVRRVTFLNKNVWVIFGRKSSYRDILIPARIKTILQEDFKAFPVPDKYGMEWSGEELANNVRNNIEKIKSFRTNIMPHITKKELFTEPDFDHLSKVFKSITEKFYSGKLTENTLYRGAFKIAFDDYDKTRNI